MNQDSYVSRMSIGPSYGYRPDRPLFSRGNERSIITSVYNRIALDVSSMTVQHVRLDSSDRFKEVVDSGLNNCLTVEANVDQTGRAFMQDIVMSMLDEGCVAIIPVDTKFDPELQEMADTAQKVLTEAGWDETGKQIVKGLTEGVQSEKSSFVDEITQLALAGVQAAKSTLDIHSPSRVFREIGNYTGLGFVKGLQDYVDRSYAAGYEMAESAEGGLSGVLQTIADIVSGGFDMEPVIRPVLDLSAVSAGADTLNNLFYSQRAVGLVGQAAVAFEAQRGGSSQTTISVDNDDVVAELRTLRGEMASMLERMEKLRVVLNTGALVGELAEPMDVALGQRSTQRGRGI